MHARLTTLLLILSLFATACGARLTDEQRAVALRGAGVVADAGDGIDAGLADRSSSDGAGTSAATGASTSGATGGDAAGAPGATDPRDPGTTGDVDGDTDAGDGAVAADGGAVAADGGVSGESSGDQVEVQAQSGDTRAAPEGGNGGATDVGVSEDAIVLGNVSDVSGPVPGIFEPSQLAVKAYIAYFTAREGTIFGRKLQYLPKDGRLDTGANRTASIEVCENAFMSVGSMSAMDQGAAPVIDECEIPDLRTASTTDQMSAVDNAWATSVSVTGVESLSSYAWFAEQFPDAVTKAAFLFICGEVTEQNTAALIAAQEAELGYEYVYRQCIEIQETNYAPFVANMQERGVEYVTFQGAYQQAARLATAMAQQDFDPQVYVLQSNTYNQNMLRLGGQDIEGDYIITTSAVVEEMDQVEELQLYAQWLEQVAPGERPTGLGMYSWSAAKLAVELLKQIGPEPTRAKMRDAISGVEEWTGGGLHGPQDVGPKRLPTDCYNVLQVQGGTFVKIQPTDAQVTCGNRYSDMR